MPPLDEDAISAQNKINGDLSGEAAELERDLVKPAYRPSTSQQPAAPSTSGVPKAASSQSKVVSEAALPPSPRKAQPSAVSPFPITYRGSPSKEAHSADDVSTPQRDLVLAETSVFPDVSTVAQDVDMIDRAEQHIAAKTPPRPPHTFAGLLPPLPDALLKSRIAVGGLAKKKAKDRVAAAQHPSSQGVAVNNDLYKLGFSRASHLSVRNMMGVGGPTPGRARSGGKALVSSDWRVAFSEMQTQKAMERIEHLKNDTLWSLRQVRKQRGPGVQKAHWDYLLEEMRWMAIDVKQETRWKIASAYLVAQAVRRWHEASGEQRAALCIKTRPHKPLAPRAASPATTAVVTEDVHMAAEGPAVDAKGAHEVTKDPQVPIDAATAGTTPALESPSIPKPGGLVNATGRPPVPPEIARAKKYHQALVLARSPMLDLPPTQTVADLSKLTFPTVYDDLSTYDLLHESFQELPGYGPPAPPSADMRQNKRFDESSPNHSRITSINRIYESKPMLVSTLNPARKRKRSGGWSYMMDLTADDKDPVLDMFISPQGQSKSSLTRNCS